MRYHSPNIPRLPRWLGVALSLLAISCAHGLPSVATAKVADQENTVRIYKRVAPTTVYIQSVFPGDNQAGKGLTGIGSGVLLDTDGLILTNAHLVADAAKIQVTLHDGSRLAGDVVGTDLVTDLAVLRVKLPKGTYKAALLGDSDQTEIGQRVMAIGHPFGMGYALTTGVVSGFGPPSHPGQSLQGRFIQLSAPINPGNSGGPLVDTEGRVIGINTAMLVGAQNIGFAIPINTAKTVVTELLAKGRIVRPWLGISGKLLPEEVIELFALPLGLGLLVMHIDEGSPAKKAGLVGGTISVTIEGEPWVLGGNILVGVNGVQLKAPEDLVKIYNTLKVGQTAELSLLRDGEPRAITVRIEEQPQPPVGSAFPKIHEPVGYRPASFILF
jgi:serine protease Do